MKSKLQLEHLRIASPCPTTWEQMKGDERTRFCELCNLHVYNIAELTAAEARSLVINTEGRLCARLYRRSDGTVITKDCPVGLRAVRRRIARVAGAAFATILSLCGGAFGQKAKDDKSCRQQVKISRTLTQDPIANNRVEGTIFDSNGAVIPGAVITINDAKSNKVSEVKSADDGRFVLSNVAPGVYEFVVTAPGFKNFELANLTVTGKETVNVELIVTPAQDLVMVGAVAYDPMIDDSSYIKTKITETMIRSLPIP